MNAFAALLLTAASLQAVAAPPDSINLAYCYRQASANYPLAVNMRLQKEITELNSRIAHTAYYPDVQFAGKASYRSEVTAIPPLVGAAGISRDQYEAAIEVNQLLFNGGAAGIQKRLKQARGSREVQAIRVQMYNIRLQVNQVYFGLLLSRRQAAINALLVQNIREQLAVVGARVRHGVLLPSQQHILEAELLRAQQDSSGIQSDIQAGIAVLGELIGEELSPRTPLAVPDVEAGFTALSPDRPEYAFFDRTRSVLEKQRELAGTALFPKISAFGRAAYGRPGLNFLNDTFHDYYIGGIQLRWNLRDAANADRRRQVLKVEQQKISQNERAFTTQMRITLHRIRERIDGIRENMKRDRTIIELREQVVEESASQLSNGTITATEYVTQLNRVSQARLSLQMNRVRLAQAKVEYMTALGQPITDETNNR